METYEYSYSSKVQEDDKVKYTGEVRSKREAKRGRNHLQRQLEVTGSVMTLFLCCFPFYPQGNIFFLADTKLSLSIFRKIIFFPENKVVPCQLSTWVMRMDTSLMKQGPLAWIGYINCKHMLPVKTFLDITESIFLFNTFNFAFKLGSDTVPKYILQLPYYEKPEVGFLVWNHICLSSCFLLSAVLNILTL